MVKIPLKFSESFSKDIWKELENGDWLKKTRMTKTQQDELDHICRFAKEKGNQLALKTQYQATIKTQNGYTIIRLCSECKKSVKFKLNLQNNTGSIEFSKECKSHIFKLDFKL